mgnify:CR=1 FL=1
MRIPTIVVIFFLLLPLATAKTCSQEWGASCDSNIDDSFDCNGIQSSNMYVKEVYVNSSKIEPEGYIKVVCEFCKETNETSYEYVFYFNGNEWKDIENWQSTITGCENKTAMIKIENYLTKHWIRCTISNKSVTDYCADSETSTKDNDDVSIDVISRPVINSLWFEHKNKETNKVNLKQNITVFSDISNADNVSITIKKPLGEEIQSMMDNSNGVWIFNMDGEMLDEVGGCLLYTSPSPRD